MLAHDVSTLPPGLSGDYYGEVPHTWSPYWPDYPQPLADYAVELLRKCLDLQPTVGSMNDKQDPLRKRSVIGPALVLVDPWMALSTANLERLEALNRIEESWVSVLIVWPNKNRDMNAAERDLHQKLREHLGRKLDSVPRRCEMAASGIPTLQDFGEILPEMAMTMLKRYRRYAPAPRRTPT